jgi:hypothetical protein
MNVNTSTALQPINTQYKGYLFRSRLEARWAKFFDMMGFEWEYEPEGFDMGYGDLYLPDFRLKLNNGDTQWVEIKPKGVTSDDKFDRFAAAMCEDSAYLGANIYAELVSGDPMWAFFENTQHRLCVCPTCKYVGIPHPHESYMDECETYLHCWACDFNKPENDNPHFYHHKGVNIFTTSRWNHYVSRINRAATVARSARFEQGAK